MAEAGLLAYPALLGAFCALAFLGRGRSAWLERVRVPLMGVILGCATAAHVGLVALTGWSLATFLGSVSLVGAFALAGLHFYGRLARPGTLAATHKSTIPESPSPWPSRRF